MVEWTKYFTEQQKAAIDTPPLGEDPTAAMGSEELTDRLLNAIRSGNESEVQDLLHAGASPSRKSRTGASPVVEAVRKSNQPILQKLLAAGASPNVYQGNEATPLLAAADLGNFQLIELLLTTGANPNLGLRVSGLTPLHIATEHFDVASVELLLKSGADRTRIAMKRGTPLQYAYLHLCGHYGLSECVAIPPSLAKRVKEVIESFVKHGEDPFAWEAFAPFLKSMTNN